MSQAQKSPLSCTKPAAAIRPSTGRVCAGRPAAGDAIRPSTGRVCAGILSEWVLIPLRSDSQTESGSYSRPDRP